MGNETITSENLVHRCKNGDDEAARVLYDRYAHAMYNICLRMMNNVPDAEDMLQDAFYQIFKNLESYRGEATIGAWIRRIVINKCLNHLKKKKPRFLEFENREIVEKETFNEQKFAYTVKRIKSAKEDL